MFGTDTTNKVTYNVYILRTLVVSTLSLSSELFSGGVSLQYADTCLQCPLVVFNEDVWLFSLVQGLSSDCRDMVSNLSVGDTFNVSPKPNPNPQLLLYFGNLGTFSFVLVCSFSFHLQPYQELALFMLTRTNAAWVITCPCAIWWAHDWPEDSYDEHVNWKATAKFEVF